MQIDVNVDVIWKSNTFYCIVFTSISISKNLCKMETANDTHVTCMKWCNVRNLIPGTCVLQQLNAHPLSRTHPNEHAHAKIAKFPMSTVFVAGSFRRIWISTTFIERRYSTHISVGRCNASDIKVRNGHGYKNDSIVSLMLIFGVLDYMFFQSIGRIGQSFNLVLSHFFAHWNLFGLFCSHWL